MCARQGTTHFETPKSKNVEDIELYVYVHVYVCKGSRDPSRDPAYVRRAGSRRRKFTHDRDDSFDAAVSLSLGEGAHG